MEEFARSHREGTSSSSQAREESNPSVYQCPSCPLSFSNETGGWEHFFMWHSETIKIDAVRKWKVVQTSKEREEVLPSSSSSSDDDEEELSEEEQEQPSFLEEEGSISLDVNANVEKKPDIHFEVTSSEATLDLVCPGCGAGSLGSNCCNAKNHFLDLDTLPSSYPPPPSTMEAFDRLVVPKREFEGGKVRIKCPNCCELQTPSALQKHSVVHIRGIFPCPCCSGLFHTRMSLRDHKYRAHPEVTHRGAGARNLKRRSGCFNWVKVPCPECCERVGVNVLWVHRKYSHPVKDQEMEECPEHPFWFPCDHCGGIFVSERKLRKHTRDWHGDEGQKEESSRPVSPPLLVPPEVTIIGVKKKSGPTNKGPLKKRSPKEVTPVVKKILGRKRREESSTPVGINFKQLTDMIIAEGWDNYFNKSDKSTPHPTALTSLVQCTDCCEKLTAIRYPAHQRTHARKTFQCDKCGGGFDKMRNLSNHKTRAHLVCTF